jgi:hypothetical protein
MFASAALLGLASVCAPTALAQDQQQPAGNAAPGTAPMATQAQVRNLNPNTTPSYANKYEVFGGLSFMNGQAGQDLPKRYNMGGGEVMGTYWLGPKLGVAADYRLEAGTTPLTPNPYNLNRVLVYQNVLSGGVQYRGPKNRYVAVDYHALFGATHGTFDSAITGYPASPTPPTTEAVGLYSNRTSFWAGLGGSIDFNQGPKWAIRISPDLIMEHFGTELREFVSVGGGVVYRFGKR